MSNSWYNILAFNKNYSRVKKFIINSQSVRKIEQRNVVLNENIALIKSISCENVEVEYLLIIDGDMWSINHLANHLFTPKCSYKRFFCPKDKLSAIAFETILRENVEILFMLTKANISGKTPSKGRIFRFEMAQQEQTQSRFQFSHFSCAKEELEETSNAIYFRITRLGRVFGH